MAKKRQKKIVDKWKQKDWYTIVAPESFNGIEMGETPSDEPEKVVGRRLITTLRDLKGDYSKSHIKLKFEVHDVKGQKAYTRLVGHEILPGYLKSNIRRQRSLINVVIEVPTTDGEKLLVKTMMVTRNKVTAEQKKGLRIIAEKEIWMRGTRRRSDQVIQEAIFGKLGAEIYKKSKKLVPVGRVEIRKTELVVKKEQ
ncbi:MAG: 30S ribosomal protein S3ae [Candidatus Diapherotrites archaeon]|nr:30S ribosomal protein S3ae [Candidatus Diapherotrites archaeon]